MGFHWGAQSDAPFHKRGSYKEKFESHWLSTLILETFEWFLGYNLPFLYHPCVIHLYVALQGSLLTFLPPSHWLCSNWVGWMRQKNWLISTGSSPCLSHHRPLSSIRTPCAVCDSLVYFCGTPCVIKLCVFFLSAWQKVATKWWMWAFWQRLALVMLGKTSASGYLFNIRESDILHIFSSKAESPDFAF